MRAAAATKATAPHIAATTIARAPLVQALGARAAFISIGVHICHAKNLCRLCAHALYAPRHTALRRCQ